MIDCHCHLAYKGLYEIHEKVVEDARKSMTAIINCGYPKDCEKAFEISKNYKGFVFLELGLHPIDVVEMTDDEVKKYLDFIRGHANDIVAIGEIGLDRHWYPDEKQNERFREVFIKCLELAEELKLPAVLHTRKAEEECFKIVNEMKFKNVNFHFYSGSLTLAKKIIECDYYISLTNTLTNSKNSKKIAQKFPIEKLLTETDSPFLSPNPPNPNTPQNVRIILEKISEYRKISIEEIDKKTTNNAIKFFNLPIDPI
jgi:TatD DNase family protein